MDNKKVLILEPEKISQELLKTFFIDAETKTTDNSNDAFKILENFSPTLILINPKINGLNGYNTCELIKKLPEYKNIPVIFLSDAASFEEKRLAYGVGGFDFISKPYDILTFKNKIDNAVATHSYVNNLTENIDNLKDEVEFSYASALNIQNNLALMQHIFEFLRRSLACNDYQSVVKLFFETTKKVGSSCVLEITTGDEKIIESDSDIIHKIENDIISMPVESRVTIFGNNRALYCWPSIRVLVRNNQDNCDYFTYLLDGMEAAVSAIKKSSELLNAVNSLQSQNQDSQEQVSELFNQMNKTIKDIVLSLGLVSSLDADEEDKLNDCMDVFSGRISNLLTDIDANNYKIREKIYQLKESEADIVDGQNKFDKVNLF